MAVEYFYDNVYDMSRIMKETLAFAYAKTKPQMIPRS